jgi:hypothetical protein
LAKKLALISKHPPMIGGASRAAYRPRVRL